VQSSNPAFRSLHPQGNRPGTQGVPTAEHLQQMFDAPSGQAPSRERFLTIDDVIARTATTLGVGIVAAVLTMYVTDSWVPLVPAMLVGLGLALFITFKRSTNPGLILAYAAVEGIALGAFTNIFENLAGYQGIGLQALVGTLGVFAGMLVVYKTGAIRVTPKFTRFMGAALIGVLALVLVRALGAVFGFGSAMFDGGAISIIISLVIIVVAALSFLLDFDEIDRAITAGAPAKSAWYFSFSLMVTLVWLYLEIVRLLAAVRSD
jgi:uncharacterized YccA/Bax inhibitor family protein